MSKLYKHLTVMEGDKQRVSAMHDRRREILEGALNDIQGIEDANGLLMEILVELSEVC